MVFETAWIPVSDDQVRAVARVSGDGADLMGYYVLKRLGLLLPTAIVPLFLIFVLLQLGPGDPAAVMLGMDATPDQVEALRERMGLDRPILHQFGIWLRDLVRFDLGDSLFIRRPVTEVIFSHTGLTLVLTAMAFTIAAIVGVTAGVLAARFPNSPLDRLLMAGAIVGVSMPEFWFALNMILLFAVTLGWLPVAGFPGFGEGVGTAFQSLIMPAVALGVVQAGLLARITRSAMLETLDELYIKTARSKGLSEGRVVLMHGLRNALIPVLTVLGLILANLISGAVTVETVFNLPGIGRLMMTAVTRRDFPLIQGIILYIAIAYILINLIIDLIYAAVDPQVRYE